ncbi:hypothetical protein ASPZODRAFT_132542 [Penicilliopsis zonata CBS 506.65]|uniref:Uncharacterized protein n=1 Tax=Penicilliopsis zonata CBS 506.65 TaxID=1073090 RepID=A0A1L9SGR8_9EURO|nr:hypothetical protein ASPZODRAFT_132542 [Penicilliopsis zonata CBS 506.65]OJJ46465.1 hypothetical protein ASPZODRAFT_132542 [Penicilliopsis zonata CBS 506.65]
MRSFYALIPAAAIVGGAVASTTEESDSWYFGNSMFYLGPPTSGIDIIKATYSIVPPSVPCGYTSPDNEDPVWVSVWVGASSSESSDSTDLYQPLFNWSPNQELQGCPASVSEWCVAASTYTPAEQVSADYVTVPQSTQVDFEISVVDDEVYQVVTMGGKVISKLTNSLDSGLQYLMSSDECYTGSDGACGTLDAWTITNLTVTLSGADEKFGDTIALYGSMTSASLTTSDDGTTWHTDYLDVKLVDFDDTADLDD